MHWRSPAAPPDRSVSRRLSRARAWPRARPPRPGQRRPRPPAACCPRRSASCARSRAPRSSATIPFARVRRRRYRSARPPGAPRPRRRAARGGAGAPSRAPAACRAARSRDRAPARPRVWRPSALLRRLDRALERGDVDRRCMLPAAIARRAPPARMPRVNAGAECAGPRRAPHAPRPLRGSARASFTASRSPRSGLDLRHPLDQPPCARAPSTIGGLRLPRGLARVMFRLGALQSAGRRPAPRARPRAGARARPLARHGALAPSAPARAPALQPPVRDRSTSWARISKRSLRAAGDQPVAAALDQQHRMRESLVAQPEQIVAPAGEPALARRVGDLLPPPLVVAPPHRGAARAAAPPDRARRGSACRRA